MDRFDARALDDHLEASDYDDLEHTVTYSPAVTGRTVTWSSSCACGWSTASSDANVAYAAAMEHGEFA